jgi:hypothetical protein
MQTIGADGEAKGHEELLIELRQRPPSAVIDEEAA